MLSALLAEVRIANPHQRGVFQPFRLRYGLQIRTSEGVNIPALCGVVYALSIDNIIDNPIHISSIIESDNSPSRFTNLSCDTERT
jgi:hypothetical protein